MHNEMFLLRFSCFPREFKTILSAKSRAFFQVSHFLFCATFCSVASCFLCVKFTFHSVSASRHTKKERIISLLLCVFFVVFRLILPVFSYPLKNFREILLIDHCPYPLLGTCSPPKLTNNIAF